MSNHPADEQPHELAHAPASAAAPRNRAPRRILIAVVIAAGLGAIYWKTHSQPGPTSATGGRQRGGGGRFAVNGPMPVGAKAAEKGSLNVYLNGLGTVTPLANITLRTQVNGQLVDVHFQEGQMVKQGDLLAVIDPRPFQVALEQAQGQLLQAQSELEEAKVDLARYETLATQDSIAKQQVDTQRALVTQREGLVQTDQAAIDSAKLNLTYCHVTAPVSGRVGLRLVDQGNYVTTGDANGLVMLTEVKPISVIFTLPEDNVPAVAERIRSGAKIPVDLYDRSEVRKLASGTLETIDNQVDTTTGTFKLRALFPNDDERLFPNQFVNVKMLLKVDQGAVVIPTSATERGQHGDYVYVIKPDNTVASRPVTIGTIEGEREAVTSGLAVGEKVVVDGADKLKDGMQVVIQSGDASGSPRGAGQGGRRRQDGGGAQ